MQLLPGATERFLRGYWSVRQRIFRQVGPLLRERHGMELADFFLLHHIAESELSPSEIACVMRVPAYDVSRRLGALTEQGMVRRELHPEDARRRVLELTPHGREELDGARSTLHGAVARMLEVLDGADLAVLLDSLDLLASDGEEVPSARPRPTTAGEADSPEERPVTGRWEATESDEGETERGMRRERGPA